MHRRIFRDGWLIQFYNPLFKLASQSQAGSIVSFPGDVPDDAVRDRMVGYGVLGSGRRDVPHNVLLQGIRPLSLIFRHCLHKFRQVGIAIS